MSRLDWGKQMFVTYNESTGQVYSASELLEPHIPEGHTTVEVDLAFADLPAHPAFCKFVGGALVHSPEIEATFEPSYDVKRAGEYPPITDYIDGVVKGDQAQIDAYIAACQAVKSKYPKPE